ncbi:MAG: response regulator [Rhodothermales bacterium]|nr:response regulator [Rhodothermales bacterium]
MPTGNGHHDLSRERLGDEICSAVNALKGVVGLLASSSLDAEQKELVERIRSGADQVLASAHQLKVPGQAASPEAAPPRPPVEPPRSGRRLLLVEDNLIIRRVVRRLLENLGHHVETAENGKKALKKVKKGAFDLVFMDIQMPVMDGLEATRRIRKEVDTAKQPWIVALTATELHQSVCRDAGADDYLGKPVRSEHLQQAVERAVTPRVRA